MSTKAAVLAISLLLSATSHAGSDGPTLEQLRKEQFKLLAEVRYELALLAPSVEHATVDDPESKRRREKYDQLKAKFIEIEAEVESEKTDRTIYVSSSSKDARLADYYHALKTRIERAGTETFPVLDGRPARGTASVLLAMDAAGKVQRVDVVKSSSAVLRRHAEALLRSLAPYELLPPAVAANANRVVFVAFFNYTGTQ
jgi:periplasmic protein TonB